MTAFLSRHTLHLTPLSPLHLGTGEDYEPTNYVIADSILYAFNPAQAILTPAQRNDLLEAGKRADLQAIQRFFRKYPEPFIAVAHSISSTSNALNKEYADNFGEVVQRENSHRQVLNRFQIERTATNPQTHAPYIPGSALKGCIRTALLEEKSVDHKGEKPDARIAAQFERDYLGSFATDLLRLFKPADFSACGHIATHIQYATNHKKKRIVKDGRIVTGKGVTGRRETILHGQYRAFRGECTLQNLILDHKPHIKNPQQNLPAQRQLSLAELAIASNRYHLPRFLKEAHILAERRLVNEQWLTSTHQLLNALKAQLESGQILLVRLGKNGGAESKTLEKYAQIKIMGARGARATYEKTTKTLWLASPSNHADHNLLPFGWSLIEIDPQSDNPALQTWCTKNGEQLAAAQAQIAALHEKRQAALEQAAEAQAQQAREAAERAEREACEKAAIEAEKARIAALPPEERIAAELLASLAEHSKTFSERNQEKNNTLYSHIIDTLQQAASELDSAAQKRLAEKASLKTLQNACKGLITGKKETGLKSILKTLRGEA
ncbi:MAG: RAMP superfamily CRISPR-associated protein [Cardiobacteriaceae bacterium]|nr:RAMP superfamily CRISPR-associated protein [Cardiobacteriaceae bacterium]